MTKKKYVTSKNYSSKAARDKADFDYLDKLSDAEFAWLKKFSTEYYDDMFLRKNGEPLHNTPELRKKIYPARNAANRDVWNKHFRTPEGLTLEEGGSDED